MRAGTGSLLYSNVFSEPETREMYKQNICWVGVMAQAVEHLTQMQSPEFKPQHRLPLQKKIQKKSAKRIESPYVWIAKLDLRPTRTSCKQGIRSHFCWQTKQKERWPPNYASADLSECTVSRSWPCFSSIVERPLERWDGKDRPQMLETQMFSKEHLKDSLAQNSNFSVWINWRIFADWRIFKVLELHNILRK